MNQGVMNTNTPPCRKAYTLAEFARMFGRHRSWAYRQARQGKLKTICGFGVEMIPSHEIDRMLGADQELSPGIEKIPAKSHHTHVG